MIKFNVFDVVLRYSLVLCVLFYGLVIGFLCIVNINSMEKVKYLCVDCKIWFGFVVYIVTFNEKEFFLYYSYAVLCMINS